MCLAVPGKVESIHAEEPLRMGTVSFGSVTREVCLAYTPDVDVGGWVLVHVGFAISVIDESEARRVFDYLDEINSLDLDSPQ